MAVIPVCRTKIGGVTQARESYVGPSKRGEVLVALINHASLTCSHRENNTSPYRTLCILCAAKFRPCEATPCARCEEFRCTRFRCFAWCFSVSLTSCQESWLTAPRISLPLPGLCICADMYTTLAPRSIGCWQCKCMHACGTAGGSSFVCPALETASQQLGLPNLHVLVIATGRVNHSRCPS